IPAHNLGSSLAVSLLDGLLDMSDGFVARQDAGNAEEAGLHDRVDAAAHAHLLRQRISIDGKETNALLDHLFLHLARQSVPNVAWVAGRVHEKDSARRG